MERAEAIAIEASASAHAPLPPPPLWICALLAVPSAIVSNGFVSTVAASMLRSEGMALKDIPNVIQLLQVPLMLYFLWSPMVDFWVRRRTWIALSSVVAGIVLASAMQMRTLGEPVAEALLFLAVVVVMLVSAALGGLMAEVVPAAQKGRGAGFYQTGNLGFGAL